MRLVYYRADKVMWYDQPGFAKFRTYFQIYGRWISPVDRTGTIKTPIRMKSLFPLPKMRVFTKTYQELCDERAYALLSRAEMLGVPIFIMWSGGIDSTTVLVSMLKAATGAQKENIIVLLTDDSIIEYADFYRKYIAGRLCQGSALEFREFWNKGLFVNGEFNDQLFGADIVRKAIEEQGFEAVIGPYSSRFFSQFLWRMKPATRNFYIGLFERLREAAPVPLKTNFDLLWWLNFAPKWQSVYMRILSHAKTLPKEGLYAPFFNTEDFQLWSMNNLDKRIKNNWQGYKWPSKDVIYDFTKDANYRDNKKKHGSLQFVVREEDEANYIDEDAVFHDSVPLEEIYERENDFV